jgi:cellulose synthase/poly-beta-1,6-N-acetylglucosamine synthase-like glycosyltransferase
LTEPLFWIAAGVVVYTYVLYPVLLWLRATLLPRDVRKDDITPSVSMIVCAHNEAESIGRKLENLASLDYPRDRFDVVIASDGSNDGTDEIVRRSAFARLLSLPRQGKIPTLNAAAETATSEILVFSDANSMYAPDALRALVRPFADPRVGGVAGDQRYMPADGDLQRSDGERAYWNLDRALKTWQSRAGSATSATGAIYAIRRSLYREVPTGVTDDFFVSTEVVAQGYRLVFSADAVAYEPVAADDRVEFGRKVRIMTRGLSGVVARRALLNPWRSGFYSLQLWSHKVLRRLVAIPLLLLLALGPWLWPLGPGYRAFVLAEVAFYAAAAAAAAAAVTGSAGWARSRPLQLPFYFCMVNAAALVAAVNVVLGRRIDLWEPQRSPLANPSDPTLPEGSGLLEGGRTTGSVE